MTLPHVSYYRLCEWIEIGSIALTYTWGEWIRLQGKPDP
ncbi:hypothetical protein JCM19235_5829 [Vibrio maritimus]|uniref:Uncharacterized protein n=1 Tax=Vibrio maritimus TaxID=990268 RepID=A0A090RPD5_9VIBR|nr:hypothetical protein JCM19235_5829 [Vibrio maritimus]